MGTRTGDGARIRSRDGCATYVEKYMIESKYITRKELAAVAEISEDTLMRRPELRRAIEESRDKLSEKPVRCVRSKLKVRLALYGFTELAGMI
jgi:hypothetical protein